MKKLPILYVSASEGVTDIASAMLFLEKNKINANIIILGDKNTGTTLEEISKPKEMMLQDIKRFELSMELEPPPIDPVPSKFQNRRQEMNKRKINTGFRPKK